MSGTIFFTMAVAAWKALACRGKMKQSFIELGIQAPAKIFIQGQRRRDFPMLPLHALGERIIVLGPSNAGKSTLAVALSKKLGFPAVHLDQLHHLPNTNWEQRPEAEFAALHDAAILGERWVMEGNYSRLMPQRFARATGAILITSNHWLRFARYLKRTLVNRADRAGHLEGAQDSIK